MTENYKCRACGTVLHWTEFLTRKDTLQCPECLEKDIHSVVPRMKSDDDEDEGDMDTSAPVNMAAL